MVLHDTIKYTLLPPEEQPKKTPFAPNNENLKKVRVEETGSETDPKIKKGAILTVWVNNLRHLTPTTGYCYDRDVIFIEDKPRTDKVQVYPQGAINITSDIHKGKVLSSDYPHVEKDDTIHYYGKGGGLELPDQSLIISKNILFEKL